MIESLPPHVEASRMGDDLPDAVADESLQAIEAKFGRRLPDAYQAFLMEIGPALFIEDGGAFKGTEPSDRSSDDTDDIEMFFGLGRGDNSVLSRADMLQDQLPQGVLPIGDGPGGDVIGLHASGGVVYWNHETGRTFKSASSFDAFLSSLGTSSAQPSRADGIIDAESSLDF